MKRAMSIEEVRAHDWGAEIGAGEQWECLVLPIHARRGDQRLWDDSLAAAEGLVASRLVDALRVHMKETPWTDEEQQERERLSLLLGRAVANAYWATGEDAMWARDPDDYGEDPTWRAAIVVVLPRVDGPAIHMLLRKVFAGIQRLRREGPGFPEKDAGVSR